MGLAAALGLGLALMPLQRPLVWPGGVRSVRSLQQTNPRRTQFSVRLQGQIGETIPLVNAYLYELRDSTGSIWVMSSTPPPPQGVSIRLTGRAHFTSIPVGSEETGEFYVEERHRQWLHEPNP